MTFAVAIKAFRECEGWTQRKMAEAIGVSVKRLSDFERGARRPSLEAAIDYAVALGYPKHTFAQYLFAEMLEEVGLEAEVTYKSNAAG